MAKKSQAIAVLEGRLNLLKKDEAEAQQALTAAEAQVLMLEDLLKSIRAAAAGSKGGRSKRDNSNVPVRQAVVKSFNEQAGEAAKQAEAAQRVTDSVKSARAREAANLDKNLPVVSI